jgi:hypothetical protein
LRRYYWFLFSPFYGVSAVGEFFSHFNSYIFYRFELPEVPSCRRSQNSIRNKEEECTDPNEFTGDSRPSLNCENALNESSADLVLDSGEKDDLPEFQLMYRHLVSKKDPENLPPVPVSCTVTEMPPFVGNMK